MPQGLSYLNGNPKIALVINWKVRYNKRGSMEKAFPAAALRKVGKDGKMEKENSGTNDAAGIAVPYGRL